MTNRDTLNSPNHSMSIAVEEFGSILKELRTGLRMTQEELSRKIGVKKQAVSKWENKRSFPLRNDILKKIAGIFRIPFTEVMKIKGIRKTKYRRDLILGSKDPVVSISGPNYAPLLNDKTRSLPLDAIKNPVKWTQRRCFLPSDVFPGFIFGFEITDKRMEPNCRLGDIVLVDIRKSMERIKDGQLVVIKVKGHPPMCRIYSSENKTKILRAIDLKQSVVRVRESDIDWCYGVIRLMNHDLAY